MARRTTRRVSYRRSTGTNHLPYIALLVFSVAILAGGAYLTWHKSGELKADPITLCPGDGPTGALAVLVDTSGPFSKTQESRVRHEITAAIDSVPSGTMVSLGHVSNNSIERGAKIRLCKPTTTDSVSRLTGNPELVAQRYERLFYGPIQAVLTNLVVSNESAQRERLQQHNELAYGLTDTGITVSNTGIELVITLPEKITFASGSAHVRPALSELLRSVASSLASHSGTIVHVVGHTDAVGTPEYNQALSEARAIAVADILVNEGTSADRVKITGRASHEPIASNDSEQGRRTNRRVEVLITSRAPIMESLQALATDTPHLIESKFRRSPTHPRKILVVSDMLQNSSAVSFYEGQGWQEFQSSNSFDRLGQNLHGVAIEVLRIPRANPAIRDSRAIEHFWARYFDYQGATVRSRVIGDL